MNTFRITVVIMLVSVMGPAWAESIDAPSTISAVTVFPDRALVTRRATVALPAGAHEVRIGPLPGMLEQDSISARGEGEAPVKLFGARVVTSQLEKPQPPRVQELVKQINEVKDRIAQLQNVHEVLRQEREFLGSIRAASAEQIGKELVTTQPKVDDVANLYAFLDRELVSTYQKAQQAEAQTRELNEQLDRLQREWNELAGNMGSQEIAIVVDLEAQRAAKFTLEVSYRVTGASWSPAYEARASGEHQKVEMTAYGVIRQQTGEEWRDVEMRLSTARPSIGGRMPQMEPWWLTKYEPPVYSAAASVKKTRRAMALLGSMMDEKDEAGVTTRGGVGAAPASALLPAVVAQASIETRGPAVQFALPARQSVPSDWQPRRVAIGSQSLPAEFAYEATPRLAPYAYLRAKVHNAADAALLPGPVQIFLDQAFVATSSIDLIGPGESFDLYLGADERIKVERKQLRAKADVSVLPGLHGRTKTIDYEFLTTIENHLPATATITLIDQVPVSQHDEIKVSQVAFDPKPTAEDSERPGVYKWQLEIPAGKKQSVKLSYRVQHPVDFVVEGL